jgi:nickel-type superoxide dismutase maturation protease
MHQGRGLIGSLLLFAGFAFLARRMLDVVEVRGRSMAPTLLPGDRLLVARLSPRLGDVVVATDPRDPRRELIKRATRLDACGVDLRGDNPAFSTDTRAFGPLPSNAVTWRAVLRYWPRSRMGRIPAAPAALTRVDEGGEPACTFPEALIAGD